jgi:AcrR family transcriptional regulator
MSSDSSGTLEQPREKPPSARDRILNVAGPLFYREGYRAIGIDRVIAEAEVAKATFYKHFPSKDDLIVAWIHAAEQRSLSDLPPESGPQPLTAYIRHMLDIAARPYCLGCTYQGSAAEFVDPAHPAHAAALRVKNQVLETLERRASAQGLADPRTVAEQVFLLLEGVWASVRMFGPAAPLAHAEAAFAKILR